MISLFHSAFQRTYCVFHEHAVSLYYIEVTLLTYYSLVRKDLTVVRELLLTLRVIKNYLYPVIEKLSSKTLHSRFLIILLTSKIKKINLINLHCVNSPIK